MTNLKKKRKGGGNVYIQEYFVCNISFTGTFLGRNNETYINIFLFTCLYNKDKFRIRKSTFNNRLIILLFL